jgi:hypothetical protein
LNEIASLFGEMSSLKESCTSADLIEHQKSILKSILDQSKQQTGGAGLVASTPPKFTLSDHSHHNDEPPAVSTYYTTSAKSKGGSVTKIVNVVAPTDATNGNGSGEPHDDSKDYLENVLEAKDRRQSWQQVRKQRSYIPSLSVICKFLFLYLNTILFYLKKIKNRT